MDVSLLEKPFVESISSGRKRKRTRHRKDGERPGNKRMKGEKLSGKVADHTNAAGGGHEGTQSAIQGTVAAERSDRRETSSHLGERSATVINGQPVLENAEAHNTATDASETGQRNPQKEDELKRRDEKKRKKGRKGQEGELRRPLIGVSSATLHATSEMKKRTKGKNESKGTQRLRAEGLAEEQRMLDPTRRLNWQSSSPTGGRILSTDVIFSPDETCLLVAEHHAMHVYAIENSLLVRSLSVGHIISYKMSSIMPDAIYIATSSKELILWDWSRGLELGRWDLQAGTTEIAVICDSKREGETVYAVCNGDRGSIIAYEITVGEGVGKPVTIWKTRDNVRSVKVHAHGTLIVAVLSKSIAIGTASSTTKPDSGQLIWREFYLPDLITCVATRVTTSESGKSKGKRVLDLVLGTAEGQIYLYEDVLSTLVQLESSKGDKLGSRALKPRQMHWHREAVGAVAWSADGNYVISGGKETVLVIWQLETGKMQFLPHLTAPIERIVVSPTASSYGVSLADNSVMVLSTTELKPKAHIAGIQSQLVHPDTISKRKWKNTTRVTGVEWSPRTPATISSLFSGRILLAVPAYQSAQGGREYLPAKPYLQTFDLNSSRHVARQALTRNSVTHFNKGPEGNRMIEPDVRLLQVSSDGKWLTTVEEWTPPRTDVDFLAVDIDGCKEQQRARQEVALKFWSWGVSEEQWVLETRIDAPHPCEDGVTSGRIFDLKADPARTGFATIGEDGCVRTWFPKTRSRSGLVNRGAHEEALVTWSAGHVIRLESSAETLDDEADFVLVPSLTRASIAYSDDASVIAASQEFKESKERGLVHLIDNLRGKIKHTRAGLYDSGLVGLGLSGRFLIIFADVLVVWDVVRDEMKYGLMVEKDLPSGLSQPALSHLAVNRADGTFAVALPRKHEAKEGFSPAAITSDVVVFDPAEPTPLFRMKSPHLIVSLLPAQASSGFVTLDAVAVLRTLIQSLSANLGLLTPPAEAEPFMSPTIREAKEETETVDTDVGMPEDDDEAVRRLDAVVDLFHNEDKPVVRPEELADVFERTSLIKDLFSAVVGLYERRPRAGTQPGIAVA